MSQDFEDVTLSTPILVGLHRLLARDLTALTKSSSQTNFPLNPIDTQWFIHTGNLEAYIRDGNSWTRMWGWKDYLPPFTSAYLEEHFQGLSDKLTDISTRGATAFNFLASPYIPFNLGTTRSIFSCASANAMRTYLGIGDVGTYGGDQITNAQIEDGTIEDEKFAFDFNKDIPRAMKTGDVKWSLNPNFDKTRFLLCDGKTIGSSQSTANYKGDGYYDLFICLGGSDSEWSAGTAIPLPDYTQSNTIFNHELFDTDVGFQKVLTSAIRGVQGLPNYIQFVAVEDGEVEVEIIGGGGGAAWAGAGSDAYGGVAAYGAGGGGGWFKGNVSLRKNDVLTLRAGVSGVNKATNASGGGHDRWYGTNGTASVLEINGSVKVTCNGGNGAFADAWSGKKIGVGTSGYGGSGGTVSTSLSGSKATGFSGTFQSGGGGSIPYYTTYGGCCGHGGQVNGSKYYAGNETFVGPSNTPTTAIYEYSLGNLYGNPTTSGLEFKTLPNTLENGVYVKSSSTKYTVTCGYSVKKKKWKRNLTSLNMMTLGFGLKNVSSWDGSITPYEGYDYNAAMSTAITYVAMTAYSIKNTTLRQTYLKSSAEYTCVPNAGTIGVGTGLSDSVSGVGAGFVRVKDTNGVLRNAGNQNQMTQRINTLSALCLIKV